MGLLAEDTNIYLPFTWNDLLVGILLLAAIVALVVCTVLLIKGIKIFKLVHTLLRNNGPAIDAAIQKFPSIATGVDETVQNVNEITGSVHHVVTNIEDLVETFATPEGPTGVFASVAGGVVRVIQIFRGMCKK